MTLETRNQRKQQPQNERHHLNDDPRPSLTMPHPGIGHPFMYPHMIKNPQHAMSWMMMSQHQRNLMNPGEVMPQMACPPFAPTLNHHQPSMPQIPHPTGFGHRNNPQLSVNHGHVFGHECVIPPVMTNGHHSDTRMSSHYSRNGQSSSNVSRHVNRRTDESNNYEHKVKPNENDDSKPQRRDHKQDRFSKSKNQSESSSQTEHKTREKKTESQSTTQEKTVKRSHVSSSKTSSGPTSLVKKSHSNKNSSRKTSPKNKDGQRKQGNSQRKPSSPEKVVEESSEEEDEPTKDCPLCLEELDCVERNLYPCNACKFQICLFCLNRLQDEETGTDYGSCPGCRNAYPSDSEWKVEASTAKEKDKKSDKKQSKSQTSNQGKASQSSSNSTSRPQTFNRMVNNDNNSGTVDKASNLKQQRQNRNTNTSRDNQEKSGVHDQPIKRTNAGHRYQTRSQTGLTDGSGNVSQHHQNRNMENTQKQQQSREISNLGHRGMRRDYQHQDVNHHHHHSNNNNQSQKGHGSRQHHYNRNKDSNRNREAVNDSDRGNNNMSKQVSEKSVCDVKPEAKPGNDEDDDDDLIPFVLRDESLFKPLLEEPELGKERPMFPKSPSSSTDDQGHDQQQRLVSLLSQLGLNPNVIRFQRQE